MTVTLTQQERTALIDAIEEVLGDSWQRRTDWHTNLLVELLKRLEALHP